MEEGIEIGLERGIEQGHLEEVRKILFRLGRKSLGTPDESVANALAGISDLGRLEGLIDRVGEVQTWQKLLSTP